MMHVHSVFLLTLLLSQFSIVGMAVAEASPHTKPLFRDFMGINGHTVRSFTGKFADWFVTIHPMEWDTGPDTNYKLDFPFARNRVSWEHVYGAWKKAGFRTDACVMIETHKPDAWNDLPADTHRYGKLFAENFGPTSKLALVESIEIGNEPGKYSDDDYRRVFENMASGVREGDPKLKIATCNVNVGKSGDYHKSVKCVEGLESLYDVLNVHSYAMLEEWPTWKRSFPENTKLPKFMQDIDELISWRDQHAVGKEIWLTEFGWDSSTKSPPPTGDFAKWHGNTDIEQAQWLVRTFFLLATKDVDRAYLYFFNDDDAPQLHGASGITRNYVPKPSFYALAHLYKTLGDYQFSRIVDVANSEALVYEFAHESDASKLIWVAWCSTGINKKTTLKIPVEGITVQFAESMPLVAGVVPRIEVSSDHDEIKIEVGESPTYIVVTHK
ncbi:MAG: hypothetical protein O2856_18820 [Planctomycetota bacterium]|nr:hypothetical protein [Planctomycetota bacterium]